MQSIFLVKIPMPEFCLAEFWYILLSRIEDLAVLKIDDIASKYTSALSSIAQEIVLTILALLHPRRCCADLYLLVECRKPRHCYSQVSNILFCGVID